MGSRPLALHRANASHPSLVQDNKKAYLKGAELLETLLQDGIQVVVSHDPQERIERILNEKNSLSENLY